LRILGEPISGLDRQTTREVLELTRSRKGEGLTVLLFSHLLISR
jgi:ABC-type multidrug transport system ATPase subunit